MLTSNNKHTLNNVIELIQIYNLLVNVLLYFRNHQLYKNKKIKKIKQNWNVGYVSLVVPTHCCGNYNSCWQLVISMVLSVNSKELILLKFPLLNKYFVVENKTKQILLN